MILLSLTNLCFRIPSYKEAYKFDTFCPTSERLYKLGHFINFYKTELLSDLKGVPLKNHFC